MLQKWVSELIPRQCAPPLDGGGLVQLRPRDRTPPLQAALHELHRDQFVQCPLTKIKKKISAPPKKKFKKSMITTQCY